MKTFLLPKGEGYVLEIDKKMLDECAIDPSQPVEVATMGSVLTLLQADESDKMRRLTQAIEKVVERYGETLKRLAE